MAHFDDAKQLVDHAKKAFPNLVQAYQASLNEKEVKPELLIDIKNIMENLRSALDYAAHGLFSRYGSSQKTNPKTYFPYAALGQSQSGFQAANRIEKCIPGITGARPDIVACLESYQHFANPSNRWLPMFMDLNNENKHEQLTPQSRKEARELIIESKGSRQVWRGLATRSATSCYCVVRAKAPSLTFGVSSSSATSGCKYQFHSVRLTEEHLPPDWITTLRCSLRIGRAGQRGSGGVTGLVRKKPKVLGK